MMEPKKPSRKSKWLSKLLHREGPASTHQPPRLSSNQDVLGVLTNDPKPEPEPILPAGNHQENITLSTQVEVVNRFADQAPPATSSKTSIIPNPYDLKEPAVLPEPHRQSQLSVRTEKTTKVSNTVALVAPATLSTDDGKGKSPNLQVEKRTKIPLLLNTDASLQNAGLWEKAYTQLSDDEKNADLFNKYETILEDSSLGTPKGTTFPKQMAAFVRSRIEIMEQKQWMLQWDQKSIVVRDQAERIVKFVQTFQNLGTAIAQIDPIHVGIPWAGVCAVLNVSTCLVSTQFFSESNGSSSS
jgi:hypothetical protein